MKTIVIAVLLICSCTRAVNTTVKELQLHSIAKVAGFDPANISDTLILNG